MAGTWAYMAVVPITNSKTKPIDGFIIGGSLLNWTNKSHRKMFVNVFPAPSGCYTILTPCKFCLTFCITFSCLISSFLKASLLAFFSCLLSCRNKVNKRITQSVNQSIIQCIHVKYTNKWRDLLLNASFLLVNLRYLRLKLLKYTVSNNNMWYYITPKNVLEVWLVKPMSHDI